MAENKAPLNDLPDSTKYWAAEIDKRYSELRKLGVVDVKFAFGAMASRSEAEVYRFVAEALKALQQSESKAFSGLNDSYGLSDTGDHST